MNSKKLKLIVDELKNEKNLPFTIKMEKKCFKNIKNCKEHHGEIVINSYNKKTKEFYLKRYFVHEKSSFEYNYSGNFVLTILENNIKNRIYTLRYLMNELGIENKTKTVHVRLSQKIFSKLDKKCDKNNISKSEFITNCILKQIKVF